jgi:hypothetical protein
MMRLMPVTGFVPGLRLASTNTASASMQNLGYDLENWKITMQLFNPYLGYSFIVLIFLFTIYIFLSSWFFPSKYVKWIKEANVWSRRLFPFLPSGNQDFIHLFPDQRRNIWIARIWSTLALGIFLFSFYLIALN